MQYSLDDAQNRLVKLGGMIESEIHPTFIANNSRWECISDRVQQYGEIDNSLLDLAIKQVKASLKAQPPQNAGKRAK